MVFVDDEGSRQYAASGFCTGIGLPSRMRSRRCCDHLAPLIATGTISAPIVATYGFDRVREAIAKAKQSGGKVLFTPKI